MPKPIGIIGGVGPQAGLVLHQYILDSTNQSIQPQCDQEHLNIYHLAWPSAIDDRTEFLQGRANNPAMGAFKVISLFETLGVAQHESIVVGVPCNTFHAKPIWDKLLDLISSNRFQHVELLNMIELTADAIARLEENVKTVGLLSTTGTRVSGVYRDALSERGIQIIEVPESEQTNVHDAIYHPEWGIKSSKHDRTRTRRSFEKHAQYLSEHGAQAIILGCTEIPLVLTESNLHGVPLIDPMQTLANSLVEASLTLESKSKPKP